MFERFARVSRRAVSCAQDEARVPGAERVEREHLLLALADGCGDPAARAIDEAGLSRDALAAAIEQDLVASLLAAAPNQQAGSSPRARSPRSRSRSCA